MTKINPFFLIYAMIITAAISFALLAGHHPIAAIAFFSLFLTEFWLWMAGVVERTYDAKASIYQNNVGHYRHKRYLKLIKGGKDVQVNRRTD